VRADICTICCGNEREQTVHCPLDCEYLRKARKRDQPPIIDPETFPNKDIRVSGQFLREHEELLLFAAVNLLQAAFEIPNVVDSDIADTLDALVRTYRTLQSGLYYQSRPENALAAAIYDRMQAAIKEFRKALSQQSTIPSIRDADLLGILVFLQRMAVQQRNGRRLGRAFIDFVREHFPQTGEPAKPATSLIV
jgi:hypothetical protein